MANVVLPRFSHEICKFSGKFCLHRFPKELSAAMMFSFVFDLVCCSGNTQSCTHFTHSLYVCGPCSDFDKTNSMSMQHTVV